MPLEHAREARDDVRLQDRVHHALELPLERRMDRVQGLDAAPEPSHGYAEEGTAAPGLESNAHDVHDARRRDPNGRRDRADQKRTRLRHADASGRKFMEWIPAMHDDLRAAIRHHGLRGKNAGRRT